MCVELRAKKLSDVHVPFAEHVKCSYTQMHNTSHVCTRCLDMIQASNAMRTLVPQTKTEISKVYGIIKFSLEEKSYSGTIGIPTVSNKELATIPASKVSSFSDAEGHDHCSEYSLMFATMLLQLIL